MKKVLFIISIFVFLFGSIWLITSCSKEELTTEKNNQNVESTLKSASTSGGVEVRCLGECVDEPCGMIWKMNEGTVECSCEGCHMSISSSQTKSRMNQIMIAGHFIDYISLTHGTDDYLMLTFDMIFDELHEFLVIEYIIDGNFDEIFSVVYHTEFASVNSGSGSGVTWLVDCSGSCSSSSEKCVEVWNSGTGEVYCKCEGDGCKMHIERVEKSIH